MKFKECSAFVGVALLLAACSGGGSGMNSLPSQSGSSNTTPVVAQQHARQTIRFAVPIKGKAKFKVTALGHHGRPDYISPATSKVAFTFDSLSSTLDLASPPANPIDLGHGQTATYSAVTAGDYYQVTLALNVLPGVHNVGLTLSDASNNILSEATQQYTLAPGTTTNATLILNGYLGSGFICDWTSCDGTLGQPSTPASVGNPAIYTLVAFPADVDGWVIMNQLDSSNNPVPFANGGFNIAENDSNNIVNITNAGPYTTPGTAGNYANNGSLGGPSGNWFSGWTFTVQCANVGTTYVEMQSTVGAAPLVGDGINTGFGVPVTCDAGLNLTVQ